MTKLQFEPGSLVRARGREWVVLPDSSNELLILRPLGGSSDETTGIYVPLEKIESASFQLPDPSQSGDFRSCRLLRHAIRLGFRSGAGPFRSFAKLGVDLRPYQLVPLLMALKLNPVRLLIADDVGVGKTIEAGVVARELLDRGICRRLAVICPPHLVDQWRVELLDKFNIEAQPITAGSAARLERDCQPGQTLFDLFPFVVVSLDFIKVDRRRDDFMRTCPELVIVDEAHTCAFANAGGRGRQQRHQLIKGLAESSQRHMLFLTATPHSGNENAFRSLIGFLHPDFTEFSTDMTHSQHEKELRKLSKYMVQRRREDIKSYLDALTPFPERVSSEETYSLSDPYQALFRRIIDYVKESVQDEQGGKLKQRVRWWSALALLRALASSPAAAASALKMRAASADSLTIEDADEIGKHSVMDLIQDEATDNSDITPGVQTQDDLDSPIHKRLQKMARDAEELQGTHDFKLKKGIEIIKSLLDEDFRPVVFCRFIHTAKYLETQLKKSLGNMPNVMISSITGEMPPQDRETRILEFENARKSVLIATDCLSEGINLQDYFNAVVHYDLSWNPTRHEQREGRVDRFGQEAKKVRMITLYGIDNQIDGIILDVLIRKHRTIRESLNISIPVPMDPNKVIEAIFEGLLLKEHSGSTDRIFPAFEEYFKPQQSQLHIKWEEVSREEEKLRRLFTHSSIKVEEVQRELDASNDAVGSSKDVTAFVNDALDAYRVPFQKFSMGNNDIKLEKDQFPRDLQEAVWSWNDDKKTISFDFPSRNGVDYLKRTHPFVEALARYVFDTALDSLTQAVAKRSGVIRTSTVKTKTTLLLVRFRFHISYNPSLSQTSSPPLSMAEECRLFAFEGSPQNAKILNDTLSETLLDAQPTQNISSEESRRLLSEMIERFHPLFLLLEDKAKQRASDLYEDHLRVSSVSGNPFSAIKVEPVLPPDIVGLYIYLPHNPQV